MAKLEVKSSTMLHLWKKTTGSEIENTVFEEDSYKISLPLVLLYDVHKELTLMLSRETARVD